MNFISHVRDSKKKFCIFRAIVDSFEVAHRARSLNQGNCKNHSRENPPGRDVCALRRRISREKRAHISPGAVAVLTLTMIYSVPRSEQRDKNILARPPPQFRRQVAKTRVRIYDTLPSVPYYYYVYVHARGWLSVSGVRRGWKSLSRKFSGYTVSSNEITLGERRISQLRFNYSIFILRSATL